MKRKTALYIIILFLSIASQGYSQQLPAACDLSRLFVSEKKTERHSSFMKKSTNELRFLFSFLFYSYKEFFSSQDIDVCVFSPSCSTYSIQSIHRHGVAKGLLESFDRLSRCSPLSRGQYPLNKETNRLHDPVE